MAYYCVIDYLNDKDEWNPFGDPPDHIFIISRILLFYLHLIQKKVFVDFFLVSLSTSGPELALVMI